MGLWQISRSLRALESYKKHNQIKTCSRVLPKGKRLIFPSKPLLGSVQHTHISQRSCSQATKPLTHKAGRGGGFVGGHALGSSLLFLLQKKKKKSWKTKTKGLLFGAGSGRCHGSKANPAQGRRQLCSRWACPTGREHGLWKGWLETKQIHGIWRSIKTVKCDTMRYNITITIAKLGTSCSQSILN